MNHEIRSISPQRLARLMAVVLGGLMLLISLLMLPIFLFAPFPENAPNQPPKVLIIALILFYPLFGAFWGWICGQISARIYNLVARRIGGVLVEMVRIQQTAN